MSEQTARRGMRTIGRLALGAGLAAAGVLVPTSPAAAEDTRFDVTAIEQGPGPTVARLDRANRVIRDGGEEIPVPGSGAVHSFRPAAGAATFVVRREDDGGRDGLVRVRPSGAVVLARDVQGDYLLSSGDRAGRLVAYVPFQSWDDRARTRIVVRRVSDRAVVARSPRRIDTVLAFRDGAVWTNHRGHLARWDVASGRMRVFRQLPEMDAVDLVHGYGMRWTRDGSPRFRPILGRGTWTPWTAPARCEDRVIGWSPDGQHVATAAACDVQAHRVLVRDARTGRLVQAFRATIGFYGAEARWEDGNRLLFGATGRDDSGARAALVRLRLDGGVVRTSRLNPGHWNTVIPAEVAPDVYAVN